MAYTNAMWEYQYREPSNDTERKPELVIYDDDKCACCGTKDNLGIVQDWILCGKCEKAHREGEAA